MNQALYPKERYPQGHADLAGSLNNLGAVLLDQGAYGEARGYFERALTMCSGPLPQGAVSAGTPQPGHQPEQSGPTAP